MRRPNQLLQPAQEAAAVLGWELHHHLEERQGRCRRSYCCFLWAYQMQDTVLFRLATSWRRQRAQINVLGSLDTSSH